MEAELERLKRKQIRKAKKYNKQHRAKFEVKYGDVMLNRNSSTQKTSKTSILAVQMMQSHWLRGKEHRFRDVDDFGGSATNLNKNLQHGTTT